MRSGSTSATPYATSMRSRQSTTHEPAGWFWPKSRARWVPDRAVIQVFWRSLANIPREGAASGFGAAWLPGWQPFGRSRYLNQWGWEGACLAASEEQFDGFVREASPG